MPTSTPADEFPTAVAAAGALTAPPTLVVEQGGADPNQAFDPKAFVASLPTRPGV